MNQARSIPTSRAYWELKAEQILNRVFEPDHPIEVEIYDTSALVPGASQTQAPGGLAVDLQNLIAKPDQDLNPTGELGANPRPTHQRRQQPTMVLAGASVAVTMLAGLAITLMATWNQNQLAIREERNMLLIERLRAMGPASSATTTTAGQPSTAQSDPAQDGELQPPPPGEAWMEELASLPASSAPSADVLKVPLNNRITSPAPPASGSNSVGESAGRGGGTGNLPQLVGVVQVPGQSGSAIFQLGGSSTSTTVGESIGDSGWRLRMASGNSAVIEKGGEQRKLNIISGF